MRSKINRLGKELFLVGAGQALAAAGSIVGVRLLTGVLTPQAYGELALAITFVTLTQQILVGPLSASLTRYFNVAQEKNEVSGFLGSSSAWLIKISQAMGVIFLLGAGLILLAGASSYVGLALFTLIFALLSGLNINLDSIQTAGRQRAVVAWHQGIGQWLRFAAAALLVIVLGVNPAWAMAGYGLSACLVLGSQAYFFQRKIPLKTLREIHFDPKWSATLLNYAIPFASWGIFTWLQLSSDRWALQAFSSTQDVGFYAVLYQLGYYPVMMLSNVFVQFAGPILFRQAGDGTDPARIGQAQQNTTRLLFGTAGLTLLAVIFAALLHSYVFEYLAAPEYRAVSHLLPVIVLSSGLFACGQIASMAHLNRGDPKALLWPKITLGIFGALFNVVGVYLNGLTGVVYAGVVFSGLYLIWVLVLQNRVQRKRIPDRSRWI